MVDVSAKESTVRMAVARGKITMQSATADMLRRGNAAKGDVLAVARLAGIGATKMTSLLIPLCHAIPIESVDIEFSENGGSGGPEDGILEDGTVAHPFKAEISCTATVKTTGKTGVEIEAMTAVSVACLTIYDMVKGVDRGVQIGPIELLEKYGGKSGTYRLTEHG